jgi:hypothetical protein
MIARAEPDSLPSLIQRQPDLPQCAFRVSGVLTLVGEDSASARWASGSCGLSLTSFSLNAAAERSMLSVF